VPLIELKNLCIDFPVYGANAKSFRHAIFRKRTGGTTEEQSGTVIVRAIKDLNLKIYNGDRIGLIGHNGAGKSTLLRALAGVYEPTNGSIIVKGKISALFNPTLGMDSDDTAIENIYSIGHFLGMSKKEINSKIDDIASFTELGEFLYLPVRTYSSGMQLRLAFAIATSIDPDILLLDEGIGVGDARFAARAQKRMNALLARSNVLVIASHSDEMIRSLCNKALLMEEGCPVFFGDVDEALNIYHSPKEE